MKKTLTNISLTIVLTAIVIFSSAFLTAEAEANKTNAIAKCETCSKNPSTALISAMHKLWEDHVVWTRNVIFCLVDDLPGGEQATARLMQNQTDIGNAIKPYYGDEAGNKLAELLKSHIAISADVIKAAKTSNNTALDEANKKWQANADEISEFLAKANPNWKLNDLKKMMDDHLKLTTDEVVQRIKKDYSADIKAYDKVHDEILEMSDMLSEGIIKQFPDKFKTGKTKNGKVATK